MSRHNKSTSLGAPLSRALLPLTLGMMRRIMLRHGARSYEQRLYGMPIHFFQLAAQPGVGSERPVVLIHGIADSALTWLFVLQGMAAIGPVYALDLPGFGQSGYPQGRRYATIDEQVAVVQALIRDHIGRPALLVGNSMGGWIAAKLAARTPELTRGIVLVDPGGALLDGRTSWEPFARTAMVPDLATVRRIYRQMFGRIPLALYLGQQSFQALFQREAVRQFIMATREEDLLTPGELRSIRVPVALVWGQRDTFLPDGSFTFFCTHLPQAQILELPGCGHLPQRERPRELVRFTRHFARLS